MTTTMEQPACAPASPLRPSNVQAQKITGRTYLSHSQLTTMRTCPRKFSFQYVEQVRPDFIASSLLFGGSVHYALEVYFRAKLEGLGITHGALLSAYHDEWKRQVEKSKDVTVRLNKAETIDTLQAQADRMLKAFLDSPLANPKGLILGVEEEITVLLAEDLPDVLARVDLVTQTDGSLHIVDFKTSRSKWTDEKAHESGEQLLLYGVAAGRMSRHLGLPVKLHFAIITKAKKPIVQLFPVPTDIGRLDVLTDSVRQIWQAIITGNFYPNPTPMNCATCAFRNRCPIFSK